MKNPSLVTLALGVLLASASAASATTKTATLLVRGVIPQVCTLGVTPTSDARTLDLTRKQQGVNVGTIAAQCNVTFNGYSLDVDTRNASRLVSPNGNPPVGYVISLEKTVGREIDSGGYFAADSNRLDIPRIRSANQQEADILLSTTSSTPYAGTYSDTLTFTLTTL